MREQAEKPVVLRSGLITCPHGFSTRSGGVSEGIYESLNLGRVGLGDEPGHIEENWRRFGAACGIDTADAVMIGDRAHDVEGAHQHGIPCIGVTWGFGSRAELEAAGAEYIADTPEELKALLLS